MAFGGDETIMSISSIHGVFLRNRFYLGRTVVTSFCVHFEKIGRGLLREGKRREGEWAVWAKGGGMNRNYIGLGINIISGSVDLLSTVL